MQLVAGAAGQPAAQQQQQWIKAAYEAVQLFSFAELGEQWGRLEVIAMRLLHVTTLSGSTYLLNQPAAVVGRLQHQEALVLLKMHMITKRKEASLPPSLTDLPCCTTARVLLPQSDCPHTASSRPCCCTRHCSTAFWKQQQQLCWGQYWNQYPKNAINILQLQAAAATAAGEVAFRILRVHLQLLVHGCIT
jgi:hypothetical protein